MRIPDSPKFVTSAEGKKMKTKIRAFAFVECAAIKKLNLGEVFTEAVRAVEKRTIMKKSKCQIL